MGLNGMSADQQVGAAGIAGVSEVRSIIPKFKCRAYIQTAAPIFSVPMHELSYTNTHTHTISKNTKCPKAMRFPPLVA
jgi:hypothetical protein